MAGEDASEGAKHGLSELYRHGTAPEIREFSDVNAFPSLAGRCPNVRESGPKRSVCFSCRAHRLRATYPSRMGANFPGVCLKGEGQRVTLTRLGQPRAMPATAFPQGKKCLRGFSFYNFAPR